jgi:hypothetical protein
LVRLPPGGLSCSKRRFRRGGAGDSVCAMSAEVRVTVLVENTQPYPLRAIKT